MTGIYKITSPTNKVYVGQAVNINKRKRTYKYFKSYRNNHGPKIYNSLVKYNWGNHKHEIIEECSIEQLDERETYWKQYYLDQVGGDWSKVLFCDLHDQGSGPRSEETKKKISKSKKGTKGYPKGIKRPKEFGESIKSKERNKKIGEGNKGKLKPGSGNSEPLSLKHKQNISKSSKGKIRNNIPVNQYDKKGNFIKTWNSQTEAAKSLNIIQSCISDTIKGRQITSGGYIWGNKENDPK